MKKYHPHLAFLLTAFLVVGCSQQAPEDTLAMSYTDGSSVTCTAYGDRKDLNNQLIVSGYNCPLACPDGSTVSFDMAHDGLPSGQKFSKEELQAKYCTAGAAATLIVSITPAPTPTETPSGPAPAPAVAAPLLTGQVTTCDLYSRYINFRLAEGAPVVSGDEVVLTMGGTPLKCTVPPSNKTILSCLLPAGIDFPAQVSIAIGGSVADQFSYNGEECYYVEPTNTNAPTSQPAPTPTSTP